MEHLQNTLISLGLFLAVTISVIAMLDFILKFQLIRSGQADPQMLQALSRAANQQRNSLKWGLILFSAGLGLVLIHFLPGAKDLESPLPYGIEFICIALGFLTYYLVTKTNHTTRSNDN